MTSKLRGYMYEIVEMYPIAGYELGVHSLSTHDNLDDANTVMTALESANINWTCYGIIMRPVWEERIPKPVQEQLDIPGDFITATGELHGWDANGSPTF
jgi:hypothetical protein